MDFKDFFIFFILFYCCPLGRHGKPFIYLHQGNSTRDTENYNVFSINYKYVAYVLYVLYLYALGNYAFEFPANFMAKIFYLADY